MAKVTLKDPDSNPKKFNKTVVLELTPREAVLVNTLITRTGVTKTKSIIYDVLSRAGVPVLLDDVWAGTSIPPTLVDRIENMLDAVTEGAN